MRELRLMCVVVLGVLFHSSVFGQESFSNEEIQEDLKILYDKLVKIHPGLYRYQDSTTFHENYLKTYQKERQSLNAVEALGEISPLINNLKDLHTGIYPSKKWFKTNRKTIPLYMSKQGGKFLISYSCAEDSNIVRGTEILHVGHQSLDSLWQETTKLYGPDNGNEVSINYYSTRRFFTYLKYIQQMPDSLEIGFRSQTDSVWTSWVKPVEAKVLNKRFAVKYRTSIRKNLTYEVLDSTYRVAKINITTFKEKGRFLQSGVKKFKKKLAVLMEQVECDSIQYLALDVRGNGGGSIGNIPQVIRYFAKEPFPISSQWSVKKSAFWSAFPVYVPMLPIVGATYFNKKDGAYRVRTSDRMTVYKLAKKHRYDGELYILGNGGSYSATTFTTSLLLDQKRATYIGERAGGAKWGSYAGRWYSSKLPNTKIRFRIPYYKIEHALTNPNEDFFIEPEYKISPTMQQFMEKEDPAEAFLIDLIKSK